MGVKTIIWDLDGVLIWHHPHDPAQDWRGKIVSEDVLSLWEKFQSSPAWERCLRDHALNTRNCFLDYLSNQRQDLIAQTKSVIDVWLEHNSQLCEPALRKLQEWQESGFECAIASNQDGVRKPYIESWLHKHGLGELPRFISCDVKMAKPDKDYFVHVQETLKREPEELLLLDDKEENISAAREAGWITFLIDESYRLNQSKWDSMTLFSME